MALSEAQRRASKKYKAKHRDRVRYLNKRSAAKMFVTTDGTIEDVKTLQKLIEKRLLDEA
ncbi:hypothetical protein G8J22_00654 [Lentilactobacillus hilgardii]|uniref:hypothetical protein n=1 Tax=Lentilactobacillus hilgardii TaxID=1588 RepID=UPI00019C4C50|nr:hypothetical protein [Lentilactobacillus hilgardii]EEI20235.1 hypothetical protein HMPREF0497_0955 [Lentilactobacillus buchneri ATCC 11577]MCT3396335.1 hypothetical protein [Lentilactobacillus hilgardii]QIR08720.1 hypothetical protein G8J22_00654 [Lentilactobacillus hilgardii]